ncbi:MAG: cryptochrome/photolyase family protein [Pirellulales bacterium]
MTSVALVFPHQLYRVDDLFVGIEHVVLVEEPLLFRLYRFHSQKLVLHRASLRHFADELRAAGRSVRIIDSHELHATADLGPRLKQMGAAHVRVYDPVDDWLESRLRESLAASGISLELAPDPYELTSSRQFDEFAQSQRSSRLFFTDFYVRQRKRLGLLLDDDGKPLGGKWSFDPENRRKLPKGLTPPPLSRPALTAHTRAACESVRQEFPQVWGAVDDFAYPVTPQQARAGLREFLEQRFANFGDYEDAMHSRETFLFHSVLTPALNIGLLSPRAVVDAALEYQDRVPINSLEGFVRQVIGWREYIRGVYRRLGRRQRSRNFWSHSRPLPAAFYDGTTGIEPVDNVVRRVLRHGYCHHIERLMVLGAFMLLCEIDPDHVYQWFMELFIDAYDWVMVPNVYGMSQYADGGLITTKPYLCGSSYVLRMSDYRRGAWCGVWDALYWRFIHKHRDFFAANPRMSVMVKQCDRMGTRLDDHLATADRFLSRLA